MKHQDAATPPNGRRYLAWMTAGLILGISFALHFPIKSGSSLIFRMAIGSAAGILLSILSLSSLEKRIRRHLPDLLLFWFVLLAFFLGILRVYIFDALQYQSLQDSAGTPHKYIGVLTEDPALSTSGKTYGFPVRVLYLEAYGGRQKVSGSLRLYVPAELAEDLSRGNTVSFSATLTPPAGASYSGGFSTRDYLYRQGYLFQAYTETLSKINLSYEFGILDRIRFLGESIRSSILRSIDQSFGEKSEESALLKGIILGVQEDFTPEQYQAFVESGLVHITSVSGMHVMFLSGFFLAVFRRLRVPKRLIYLILFPALFLFSAVASFTPSVCRSTIMMLLFYLAQLIQREPDTLTSLSAATVILLLMNPYSLTSYSFLLSFSSTLGIILFAPPILYRLRNLVTPKKKETAPSPSRWHKSLRRFLLEPALDSVSMTAGCLLGMGYFGMRFFRRISWGSFPANLCLLPLASPCFLLGLINCPMFYLCPALARFLARGPLWLMLWLMNRIADFFSHPLFRIVTPTPPASFWLPYLVFCIALYVTIKPRQKNSLQ